MQLRALFAASILTTLAHSVAIRITWIPSVPNAQIIGIRCRVEETLTWKSPKVGGPTWTGKPRKISILDKRPINKLFQPVSPDDPAMLWCQFDSRFPHDEQITPSTLPFSHTPMEASHNLIAELTFFNGKTLATKEMRYTRALVLSPVHSRIECKRTS